MGKQFKQSLESIANQEASKAQAIAAAAARVENTDSKNELESADCYEKFNSYNAWQQLPSIAKNYEKAANSRKEQAAISKVTNKEINERLASASQALTKAISLSFLQGYSAEDIRVLLKTKENDTLRGIVSKILILCRNGQAQGLIDKPATLSTKYNEHLNTQKVEKEEAKIFADSLATTIGKGLESFHKQGLMVDKDSVNALTAQEKTLCYQEGLRIESQALEAIKQEIEPLFTLWYTLSKEAKDSFLKQVIPNE